MDTRRWQFATLWTLCLVLFLTLLTLVPACAPMKALDDAVWGSPALPPGATTPDAPPIVQLAAAGLAALGLPGLYMFLRRKTFTTNAQTNGTTDRLAKIEADVKILLERTRNIQ